MPRWFAALALALIVCGVAGLSQSSWLYGMQRDRLFAPAQREAAHELFGTSRFIRSDEWAVETPQVRAQQLAGFPLVNLNEGLGELQRNTYDIPVLDWGLPFRPLTWPYFFPGRWSHGLRWFLRDALLLCGLYALLASFVEERTTAAVAATAVYFSSAFVWWRSTVMLEFVGLLSLTGGIAARALRERAAGWFVATGYAAACSFCVFYPPVWAPMLWVVCPALLDIGWRRQRLGAAAALVAVIAAGAALGLAYHLPYISLVSGTVYPGRRLASAGGMPPGRLIEMVWPSLTISAPMHCGPERYLGIPPSNVCEASSIEVLPLFLLPALALASSRVRRAFGDLVRTSPASVLGFAVLCGWLFLPLPAWFGRATLLQWSPAARAWIGFGVSAALLASRLLAGLRADPGRETFRWRGLAGVIAVAACAAVAKGHIHADGIVECYARAWIPPMVLAAILLCAGAMLSGTARGATVLLAAWAGSLALANHRVNPLVHSRQLFAKGEGHRAIDRALARAPGRVLEYSTHFGTQLAAFGWPMLGGTQDAPDLALFRFLAPESPGLGEEVYNRYAHYGFEAPPARSRLIAGDDIRVAIPACSRRLETLAVNHLLTEPDFAVEPDCAAAWTSQPAGELRLWSRRTPVCAVGVARREPGSALDLDFACGAEARFEAVGSGFRFEAPSDPSRWWAIAINPAVIETIRCEGASARILDAHVVMHPDGSGARARCGGRFLDSPGALRRLLEK